MKFLMLLGITLLAATLAWVMIRVFVRRGYRPGALNNWNQRNDIRKDDARGPDNDFAALGIGTEGGGGDAE